LHIHKHNTCNPSDYAWLRTRPKLCKNEDHHHHFYFSVATWWAWISQISLDVLTSLVPEENWYGFFQAWPSCHQDNSVKELKGNEDHHSMQTHSYSVAVDFYLDTKVHFQLTTEWHTTKKPAIRVVKWSSSNIQTTSWSSLFKLKYCHTNTVKYDHTNLTITMTQNLTNELYHVMPK